MNDILNNLWYVDDIIMTLIIDLFPVITDS